MNTEDSRPAVVGQVEPSVRRPKWRVISVTDDGPAHFAVREPMFGAVCGRFLSKPSAEALCARVNDGETPDLNPRGILDA